MAQTTVRAGQIVTADTLNSIFLSFGRLLQKTVLNADSTSVTFPDIDQGYTNLRLVCVGGFAGTATHYVTVQVNGDNGENYNWFATHRFGDSTWGEGTGTNATQGTVGLFGGEVRQSTVEVLIPGYTLDQFHNMHGVYSGDSSGTTAANIFAGQAIAVHNTPVAVRDITVRGGSSASYLSGSAFALYGLP